MTLPKRAWHFLLLTLACVKLWWEHKRENVSSILSKVMATLQPICMNMNSVGLTTG